MMFLRSWVNAMAKYIQIGALVEKEHGLEAYNNECMIDENWLVC